MARCGAETDHRPPAQGDNQGDLPPEEGPCDPDLQAASVGNRHRFQRHCPEGHQESPGQYQGQKDHHFHPQDGQSHGESRGGPCDLQYFRRIRRPGQEAEGSNETEEKEDIISYIQPNRGLI